MTANYPVPLHLPERSPILSGWKAIAKHLEITPRHAQRLAGRKGLPVHRSPANGSPWAFASELDTWRYGSSCTAPRVRQLEPVDWRNGSESAIGAGDGRRRSSRVSTCHIAGPGSILAFTAVPSGSRWSGGVVVAQDEWHWISFDLHTAERTLVVTSEPIGTVRRYSIDGLSSLDEIPMRLEMKREAVTVWCDGCDPVIVELSPWDVLSGQVSFRSESLANDAAESAGPESRPTFKAVSFFGESVPMDWLASPIESGRLRAEGARHVVRICIDDGIADLLLDNRRVLSARPSAEPVEIDLTPFLDPGEHQLDLCHFHRSEPPVRSSFRLIRIGHEPWEILEETALMTGDTRGQSGRTGNRVMSRQTVRIEAS